MKDNPFTMSVEKQGNIPVVMVGGDIEIQGENMNPKDEPPAQIKAKMIGLIEGKEINLIVDLSKATAFDSTALGVMIGILKRMRELDGSLVIVCPKCTIRRVFEITGLDKIFEIVNTIEEAVETTEVPKTAPTRRVNLPQLTTKRKCITWEITHSNRHQNT
jgi:anti-sigma B factor antagonist